jgi:hypothetical protein
MNMPPITIILVMYVIATGLLWVATRILAPKDKKISALRCFGVAFALTFLSNASQRFLVPLIGDWASLVSLVLYVLLVMGLFSLSLWRSVLVAIIYFVGVFAAYFFLMKPVE